MTDRPAESTQVFYARIAGVAYILIVLIGVLSGTLIESKLIVPGDYDVTARNILADEGLFRIAIVGGLIMYAGVLLLAATLYVVLEKVNRNLALIALVFRSGEAIVGISMALLSFTALSLLHGEGQLTALDTLQRHLLAGVFLDVRASGLDVVLMLIGVGGTIFGYLFLVSRYVPRILAAWGVLTYLSILLLGCVSILAPDHPAIFEIVLYSLGGAFELVFGAWLALKGVDVHAQPRPAAG